MGQHLADRLPIAPQPMRVVHRLRDDDVDRLLRDSFGSVRIPTEERLDALVANAGLSALDAEILVAALAPDVDARFERLYGYLHDDVTRRRPSIGLALELAGMQPTDAAARARFSSAAPLRKLGLLLVDETDRPFLTRSLRVPDRVTAFLLGDDEPDPVVIRHLSPTVDVGVAQADVVAAALRDATLCYVRERPSTAGRATATAGVSEAGLQPLCVDVDRITSDEIADLVTAVVREATLQRGGIVLGPVDALFDRVPESIAALTACGVPLVLFGGVPWDPSWALGAVVVVDAAAAIRE
jgi:hypothetical protein